MMVAEHLPKTSDFVPNLDKDSGANIRLCGTSGVILHEAPFGVNVLEREMRCEGDELACGTAGVIRTIAYRLK